MFTRWRVPVLILLAMLHAATASAQALYWVDTRFPAPTINKADANGNALSSVPLPAGSLPEGLAIDATGKVYWAEAAISSAKINRAASDLTGITPIVTGISLGRGVAVDPIAQRVYWTTSNLFIASTVRRAALDGSGVTVLSRCRRATTCAASRSTTPAARSGGRISTRTPSTRPTSTAPG